MAYFKNNLSQNTYGLISAANGSQPAVYFRPTDYVSTVNAAYSNSQFLVTMWNTGDWVDYSLDAAEAGLNEMFILYGSDTTTTTSVYTVSANGVSQGNVTLPPTASATDETQFNQVPIVVQLRRVPTRCV